MNIRVQSAQKMGGQLTTRTTTRLDLALHLCSARAMGRMWACRVPFV
jgi:hypothetical protein